MSSIAFLSKYVERFLLTYNGKRCTIIFKKGEKLNLFKIGYLMIKF